jgi:hypothetical protein
MDCFWIKAATAARWVLSRALGRWYETAGSIITNLIDMHNHIYTRTAHRRTCEVHTDRRDSADTELRQNDGRGQNVVRVLVAMTMMVVVGCWWQKYKWLAVQKVQKRL